MISGLTLATSAPAVYKSLVEATAFGSRAINERLAEEGIPFEKVVAVGGISKKSPFVMERRQDDTTNQWTTWRLGDQVRTSQANRDRDKDRMP